MIFDTTIKEVINSKLLVLEEKFKAETSFEVGNDCTRTNRKSAC